MKAIRQAGITASVFGAFTFAFAFLFMNLDGYQTHLFSPWGRGDFFAEPPAINYCHGWPVCFLIRCSNYSPRLGKGHPVPAGGVITGPLELYSSWPIDSAPVFYFSAPRLIVDVTILFLIAVGAVYGLRPVNAWLKPRPQFTIRALLLLTTVVSIVLAFGLWRIATRHWLQYAALCVIIFGCGAAVSGVINSMVRRIRRPA